MTRQVNGSHILDRNVSNIVEDSIQGGTLTGSGFVATDPQLEPLGDNGGLTFTHAFPSGSPAHNNGSDGLAGEIGVTTDQRGLERFVGQVDLGSFELQAPALAANYTWDNAANTLHISLNSGQSLTVSESGGVVTFMVDTGVFAHDVGDTATGDTTDTLTFDAADLAVSVMIDNSIADTGTNNVTFSGAGSLSSQTVSVNLSDPESLGIISFTGGFDVATTTGGLSLTTPRNISIGTDSVLSTTDGAITLSANQQLTPSTGTFVGIEVVGTVQSTGAGAINLTGRGGTAGNFNPGVRVNNGGLVTSATGAIALTGQGGASPAGAANAGVSLLNGQVSSTGTGDDAAPITVQGTGGSGTNNNNGVLLQGSTALITSVAGDIAITGQAGPGTGGSNYGVSIQSGGVIASTGTGAGAARITINATGGSGNGSTGNQGFRIANGGSQLKSVDGAIQVTATAGFGADADIQLLSTNGLTVTGAAALTLIADRMELLPTPAIAAGTSTVTLKTRTANGSIGIDVGGADSATSLGLSNAELNRITAGQIVLGDSGSGDLTVSAAVALTSGANVELRSGGAIVFNPGSFATGGSLLLDPGSGPVRPTSTGVDATASAVSFAADLEIALNGTTVNTEYTQLNVSGTVDLTGADLTLTGAHVPAVGNTFIIVAATSRIGTFNDLPAGAVISFNGRLLQISYTSTQVVLTTFEVPSNLVVDSIGDVSDGNFSAGQLSLREAIELANLVSDANTIAFDATLFATPQTITLGGSALPNLTGDVTITGPAARVTLDANQQSRHLTVAAGATARLSNLTLTRGSAADEGGAIVNHGTLTLSDCAISNNATTGEGGGIANRGTLTLSRCTLSDNSAGSSGGGIHHDNAVMLTLTDCTLSGNTSAFSGGGIYIFNSPATLTNCTLSDNSAPADGFSGGAILNGGSNSMLRLTNCTLSGNAAGSAGGAFFSNGTAILTNCTVVDNESPNGGIALSGTVTLNNTLVAGNTTDGTTPSDIVRFGGTLTANNSLIGDPNTAGGLTTANGTILGNGSGGVLPLAQLIDLVLADNGGPTRTHALATGSRALNAGSNALAVDDMAAALAFDQRGTGFPRIVGDNVDIGAFEVQAAFSGGFDGPDGSDLGDEFILTSGRFTLMGGMAVAQGSKPAQATVEGDFTDVAIDLDVSLAGNGSRAGVIARYTPKQGGQSESYYWGRLIKQDGRTFAEILRYKNGAVKELGRVRVDLEGDDGRLRFEVVGSSLKLFVDGDLVLSATDNGLSGPGLTGIRAKKGAGLDNLVVNELTATTVTLPFSDDFSTGSAGGTQLSLAWANRVGNVAVISGQGFQAVGNAPTSLATLNGLDTASVSVGAELFLLDQTGDVGLVTNFVRGPKGDSYYWARLARGAGGRVTLSIQKVKNGTATPLGGAVELPAFNFDTFHQLQFNADGGTLQVNLDNGQTVVNRTDATPLASGSVGLRVSQGNGYESFNAEDLM